MVQAIIEEVERAFGLLLSLFDNFFPLFAVVRQPTGCASMAVHILMVLGDRQEKVIDIELDVEHFFLTHVDLGNGDQRTVADEASENCLKVSLTQG